MIACTAVNKKKIKFLKTYSKVNVGWVRLCCPDIPKRHKNQHQRKCYPCHSCNEMMTK